MGADSPTLISVASDLLIGIADTVVVTLPCPVAMQHRDPEKYFAK